VPKARLAHASPPRRLWETEDILDVPRANALHRKDKVTERTEVHIGENSPEEVAFKLLYEIAEAEGMQMRLAANSKKPDRQWILDTYAECITAVRAPTTSR
jgi:hypothetical protein